MTLVKLNNRFNAPVNRYNTRDSLFDSWLNGEVSDRPFADQPKANILESDKSFIIELAIPGYDKKSISITLENNVLTVSHANSQEKDIDSLRFTKREFSNSDFSRSFKLSRWVDAEKIEASFKNGVLKIELPKKEEAIAKPAREISIR